MAKGVTRGSVSPDQATKLLKSYNRLAEASRGALKLLERMKDDGTVRLPYNGYDETIAALRKEIG